MSTTPRPFMKWAGSKQRLLKHLVPLLPPAFGRYYEPFLGSGALFFLLQPPRATLGDTASELINTYTAVRDNPTAILRLLKSFDLMNAEQFYEVRSNRSRARYKRAAEQIYLNRASWNGLYRVNSSGNFNVPYGAPKSPFLVDPLNLKACSQLLSKPDISVRCEDFETNVSRARKGDLVFLDPPYVTGHDNNGFVDYNEKLFTWFDQERLAKLAKKLQSNGVFVIVTNAHHHEILKLFSGFRVFNFSRSTTLASDVTKRGLVTESIYVGGS